MATHKFSQKGLRFDTQETDRKEGRILVSSGAQSRNRDYYTGKPYRLVPSGMRFDVWGKTGLVLYMHNFNLPMGRSSMYLEDGKLWAPDTIDFHRGIVPIATQNWIGDAVGEFNTAYIADLWDQKYLNSVSILIMFTMEDEENIVELEDEILIPTSEVIEYSIVTVPGDPNANRERLLEMGMDPGVVECLFCDTGDGKNHSIEGGVFVPQGGGVLRAGTGPIEQIAFNAVTEVSNMEVEEQDLIDLVEEVEGVEEVEPAKEGAEETSDGPVTEIFAETVELVVEEEFQDVDVLEVAQAIAEDPEALKVLATAFASDPAVLSTFVEAFQKNAEHILMPQAAELVAPKVKPTIRFVSNATQRPAISQTTDHEDDLVEQRRIKAAQPPSNPLKSGIEPNRRRHLLGLVQN